MEFLTFVCVLLIRAVQMEDCPVKNITCDEIKVNPDLWRFGHKCGEEIIISSNGTSLGHAKFVEPLTNQSLSGITIHNRSVDVRTCPGQYEIKCYDSIGNRKIKEECTQVQLLENTSNVPDQAVPTLENISETSGFPGSRSAIAIAIAIVIAIAIAGSAIALYIYWHFRIKCSQMDSAGTLGFKSYLLTLIPQLLIKRSCDRHEGAGNNMREDCTLHTVSSGDSPHQPLDPNRRQRDDPGGTHDYSQTGVTQREGDSGCAAPDEIPDDQDTEGQLLLSDQRKNSDQDVEKTGEAARLVNDRSIDPVPVNRLWKLRTDVESTFEQNNENNINI